MLNSLHIENIAVVELADVEFRPGLNILSGETGAGKSIIIDSLYAVTGGKLKRDMVRTGADRALAAAVFDADGAGDWCRENGIEPEDGTLIVQRIISADGRGKSRVNGVPVTAAQLRTLGALLVDIHGQNDGRQLLDESRHIDYLDSFAADGEALDAFRQAYAAWLENDKQIRRLSIDDETRRQLAESLGYRVTELEKAALIPGEEAELEARSELLRNGEKLNEAADGAYAALSASEVSALNMAGEARGWLSRVRGYSTQLAAADDAVKDAVALLQDAAERVRDFSDSLDFSPEEFDRVEGRLSQLRKLEKKFGAADEAELIAIFEDAVRRLSEIDNSDEAMDRLRQQRKLLRAECRRTAAVLTEQRTAAAELLAARVEQELRELSMPSVRFKAVITPIEGKPGFGPKGADEVAFLMSANAGEQVGRIARIASGGELSRIMLALKTVFGENDPVPTAVFDEIDTGVSGIAASRVGEKLSGIGRKRQVLCVSHLPQIAAMADAQYLIAKQERAGRTYTTVTELDRQGRRREIARLTGGDNITELTLASAEELLSSADRRKQTQEI